MDRYNVRDAFMLTLRTSIQGHQFPQRELVAVDVGCGCFAYRHNIREVLTEQRGVKYVIGVDINPEACHSPDEEERNKGLRFFLGDAKNLRHVLDSNGVHEEVDLITSVRPGPVTPIWNIYSSCREVISPEGMMIVLPDGGIIEDERGMDLIERYLSRAGFEIVVKQENSFGSRVYYPYIFSAKPI